MLALTYHGPKCVRVEENPEPRIQHPNDVVLRVSRATICGSDLHLSHGYVPDTRVGTIFGHEFTGVVEEVGPSVRTLQCGDRVVVPFNIACGTCFFCQRDRTSACENTNPLTTITGGIFGYSHTTGGYQGGQAERVRVPFADVGPMKIPDDLSDEDVLFLSDILPTGYQAAEMGDIGPADTVAVFGCGPVGLVAQRCAWLLGARRVIAIDSVGYRLDFARRYNQAILLMIGDRVDVLESLPLLFQRRAVRAGKLRTAALRRRSEQRGR
ncbi:alcohol dehydrogenase catalytic domain-containing protein [Sorangium sp. So ce381]